MPSAFVTGGASGLGRAIVRRLASEGMDVVIADIDLEGAELVAEEVETDEGRSHGVRSMAVRCDVSDRDSVDAAQGAARIAGLQIDVLINNAGFDEPDLFLSTDAASWQRLIDVDLMGVLNCTHVFAPGIVESCRQSGYGRIVNIASDAGRVGSTGQAVYSAAKGGVIAFSKTMARELARAGVTVNAVCPGPADTPMTDGIKEKPIGQKLMGGMIAVTPMKRLVTPDEVAAAVSFFASDDARFVTGQVLSVSGGLTMVG